MSFLQADNLTPGLLDGYARRAFKHGACAALAIALHDATGWPVVAITDRHNVHRGRAGGASALHWTVRRPDGLLVDVDGAHTAASLVAEYEAYADDGRAAAGTSSRADAHEWYVECQGEPVPIELARSFVGAVLERLSGSPAGLAADDASEGSRKRARHAVRSAGQARPG